ncbi:hypothetical protein [Bartonella queenslandensis]|uniref:hypothetical protein n=1 Tax=Bartonella queenslandensis TaxID=481138 RepID=UPI001BA75E77|nr:hypothetical protein [Bartonella queenslandensis]
MTLKNARREPMSKERRDKLVQQSKDETFYGLQSKALRYHEVAFVIGDYSLSIRLFFFVCFGEVYRRGAEEMVGK